MFAPSSIITSIKNPRTPFTKGANASNGLIFTVDGYVHPYANRFSFNLHIGGPEGNIALHVDHRFDQRCIVRNTRRDGAWENEERHSDIPLSQGNSFKMQVLVESQRFMIAYNQRHFCEFYHRLPFYAIDTVNIQGDVEILNYQESTSQPQFPTQPPPPPPYPQFFTAQQSSKERIYDIPQGLWNGRQIFLSGTPLGGTFSLDLMSHRNASDIGFHLSIRVDSDEVVFNSFKGGSWQAEIRPRNLHFMYRVPFTLTISAYPSEYQVCLDNTFVAMFPVRHINPSALQVLRINETSNVQISEINF